MATYNVEIRQRTGGAFGDIIYPKAHWNNIDGKPATHTPTAHTHVYSDLTGTVPTWNQNTTGNAATSTKWATQRALTIGPTAKNVDGSAAVSWSLSEIGINVVTTCPTADATAGRCNIMVGAACSTKYANWLYFETS